MSVDEARPPGAHHAARGTYTQRPHWTVEGLFQGRPPAFRLFEQVRAFIESLGPVVVTAAKMQVSFGAARKFAWVWLPQMYVDKQPETSITLTFALAREVRDPRIAAAVEARPGLWTHHVVLKDESGLDDAVKGWLRQAYEIGTRPASRGRKS